MGPSQESHARQGASRAGSGGDVAIGVDWLGVCVIEFSRQEEWNGMTKIQRVMVTIVSALALLAVPVSSVWGQVGKGLIDPNVASEAELRALPHMTPAIV